MTDQPWTSVAVLTDSGQVEGFRCGRESVDAWLHERAIGARSLVRTRLYLGDDERPIAFAATTTAVINVAEGTNAQRAGSRDGSSVGFLLAQMGVQEEESRRGVGGAVIKDVMASAARAYAEVPFPLFVVDAADESLVPYYERMGLRPLADGLRLATPMRAILRALG